MDIKELEELYNNASEDIKIIVVLILIGYLQLS